MQNLSQEFHPTLDRPTNISSETFHGLSMQWSHSNALVVLAHLLSIALIGCATTIMWYDAFQFYSGSQSKGGRYFGVC